MKESDTRINESERMLRKVLSMIGWVAASAQSATVADAPKIEARTKTVYPYVVPGEYLSSVPENDPLTRELGHGLHVVFVQEQGDLVRNVRFEDLGTLRLSMEQMRKIADDNLGELIQTQTIKSTVFPNGPQNKPFALFGGHWAAATSITWSKLHDVLSRALNSSEISVCIPHREAMIAFAKGDASYIEEMKALILKNESDGRKPLSIRLFRLTQNGPRPFNEDD